MTESSNANSASGAGDVVTRIDKMIESGNLTTRVGLSLIVSVFRDGMVIVGSFDKRMRELEEAYVRFTNTMSAARDLEASNKKALDEIAPIFRAVKWIGATLASLIIILIWSLLTGQVEIVKP